MKREQIREAVNNNPVISSIHDQLFDTSINLAEAYDKACIAIYELNAENKELKHKISAGYVRTNTSHLTYLHPPIKTNPPPAETDDWIETGKE